MINFILFLQFSFILAYEYPWIVSIQGKQKNENKKHLCAGVIVRHDYVLTSAHCLEKRLNDTRLTLHVLPGTRDHKEYPLNKRNIFIHEDWNKKPTHLLGDIALLRVPNLRLTDTVQALELPNKSYYPNGESFECRTFVLR